MIKPRTLYIISISIIALVLIGVAAYYVFFKGILADSIYGTKVSEQSRQFDLNNDGASEAFILTNYKKGNDNVFVLNYKAHGVNAHLELAGFESEANFCSDPFPLVNTKERLICFYGIVGVHSQNIEFVRVTGVTLLPVNFINAGVKTENISSDVPNFGFLDLKSNGNQYFYLDNRNYDLDPTLDSWRSYYYFKESEFIFDNKVMLQLPTEASDQEGRIN